MTQPLFDTKIKAQQLKCAQDRLGPASDDNALFLHNLVAQDIAERLQAFNQPFQRIAVLRGLGLDWRAMLSPKAGTAEITVFDPPLDLGSFPLEPDSHDLIIAPMFLHWVDDLPTMLMALRFALKPGGLVIGAMFGGESLVELRQSLSQAEDEISGGVHPRLSPTVDLRALASLMQGAGFSLPVVDRDSHEIRYSNAHKLMKDLNEAGESNALLSRPKAFTRRKILARAQEIYAERFNDDGLVTATAEVLHFSGSMTG